jgi:hypothetical protein
MTYNPTSFAIKTNQLPPVGKRNAYHQAGYAAAICLGNQQKKLPTVHFQVTIKPHEREISVSNRTMRLTGGCLAKVEGGRLVQSLPLSFAEATHHLSPLEQGQYRCAFEADIVNLLAGSLSEAKYVALRDDEVFNANLVYLGALQYYGGKQDLDIIDQYMECYIPEKVERKQKLAELFLAAYAFINKQSNWNAITTLAKFILDVSKAELKSVISCDDIITLLEPEFEPAVGQFTPLIPGFLGL